MANWDQTIVEWSLGGPLSELCPPMTDIVVNIRFLKSSSLKLHSRLGPKPWNGPYVAVQ